MKTKNMFNIVLVQQMHKYQGERWWFVRCLQPIEIDSFA
jgi:hypothetical protein